MVSYVIALLAIIALCAGWGVFQLWLTRHDPEAGKRMEKCGNCACETPCEDARDESSDGPRDGLQPLR